MKSKLLAILCVLSLMGWSHAEEAVSGKVAAITVGEANTTHYTTLEAAQPAVAQIGETSYATLAAAVEAVPANGTETTIVLLQSCTGSGIKVAANKNIVFDLNGNTYTVTNPAVGSSGTETNAFQLLKGATVTFRNGALESVATGAQILIQNYCNLTLDGVTLNAQRSDKITYTLSNNCGQVTVTGETKLYTSTGKVAFDLYYWPKGGYSEGVSVTFDENFTGLVEGKIEYDHDNTVNDAVCAEKAILTVAEGAQGLFDVTFSTSVEGANIQLKGGRYTTAPSTYCPAGYTATETTVEGETLWAVQPAVAQIGETSYATLAAAVEAVPADGTETTIVLLQSCTGSGVKVAANKNIVFDLNGNTYTVTDPAVGSSGTETNAFQLLKGATVTFRNGALESVATGAQILIQNYCNLTLDGVTLNAQRSDKIAYTLSNNCGQVTVTGETKLYASAGKVAFDLYYWPNGGYGEGVSVTFDENFTGQVEGKIEYAHDNTVTDAVCAEKAILTVAEGAQGLFDVTFSTSVEGANVQLKGGRYTTDPSTYCSAGYTATETTVGGETLWAVQPAVAQIGGKLYTSLAEAVEAVPADGTETTIVLLQSCTGSGVKVAANKNIVFDLNGNTYTVTDPAVGSSGTETNAFQLLKGATVTFRNGALESVATGVQILIQNYCNLTLDGVTLNAQRSDKIAYTLSNNCGQVTVTGATKLYTSAGKVAFDLYYWPAGGYSEGVSVTFDADFTGLVEGKIEYTHDATVNDADCAEKAILTVAEGAQGLFDVTFSTSVAGANIQLKGGRYTAAPSTYCAGGYSAYGVGTVWEVRQGRSKFVVVDAQGQAKPVGSLAELLTKANVDMKVYMSAGVTEAELAEKALVTTGPKGELKDATAVTGLKVKEVVEVLGGAFTVKQETNPEGQEPKVKLSYHYNFGVAGLEVNKQATPGELVLSVVAKLTDGDLPANRTLVGRTLQVVLEKGDGKSVETYSVDNPVFNEQGECRVAVPWGAMTHGTNTIKVKVVK